MYKPDILWFDGINMMNDAQADDLYQTIRRLQPQCIVNSRLQSASASKLSYLYDYVSTGDNEIADRDLGYEWENPGTLNTTYGYNQNDHAWVPTQEVVFRLVDIVSKGGNYLLNVGPTAEGIIPQASVDRLLEVGAWMDVNQEAIYGTSAWRITGEGPLIALRSRNRPKTRTHHPPPVRRYVSPPRATRCSPCARAGRTRSW